METEIKPTMVIRHHLGLGDHIVCNAIYRHFAESYALLIPCKKHNVESVQFMTRDLTRALWSVDDDAMADRIVNVAEKRGSEVLRLGMFNPPFDEKNWDREFFRQAGIPFEQRWTGWKVERDSSREFEPPKEPYAFIHDDHKRGFIIKWEHISNGLQMVQVNPNKTDNIFEYCRLIENAAEIHCIDSCFAILADSLPNLKAKRKVVHKYAHTAAGRNGTTPTFREGWEIFK